MAGKGDKDNRDVDFAKRSANFKEIKGLNNFVPSWMKNKKKKKK